MQISRNLTDCNDGFLTKKKYLIMDRESSFSCAFRAILEDAGVEPVRLPPKSSNMNAHLERFHLSIKSECLDRMIFIGERSLRKACNEFLLHYHKERNHQGLDNKILESGDDVGSIVGKIECRERLGGMLRCYYRDAA